MLAEQKDFSFELIIHLLLCCFSSKVSDYPSWDIHTSDHVMIFVFILQYGLQIVHFFCMPTSLTRFDGGTRVVSMKF